MREIITFDCYGTLVDFRLNGPTRELLQERIDEVGVDTEAFLDAFRIMRFQACLEDYRSWQEIIRSTLEKSMRLHGLRYQESDGDALAALVPTFGPFPEVPDVLRQLKTRYELAIISNTEDHLIKQNIELIGVEFDHVITAEQARAYKPSRQAFEYAYKTMDIDPAQVIHVAQGWEYDIIPANDLGLKRVVWINRNGRPGSPAYKYDELSDMTTLPELLGC